MVLLTLTGMIITNTTDQKEEGNIKPENYYTFRLGCTEAGSITEKHNGSENFQMGGYSIRGMELCLQNIDNVGSTPIPPSS